MSWGEWFNNNLIDDDGNPDTYPTEGPEAQRKNEIDKLEAENKKKAQEDKNNQERKPMVDDISKWSKNPKGWGPFWRYMYWGSAVTVGVLALGFVAAAALSLPVALPWIAYGVSNVYFSYRLYTKLPIKTQRKLEGVATDAEKDIEKYLSTMEHKKSAGNVTKELEKGKDIGDSRQPKHSNQNYNNFFKRVESDDRNGLGRKNKLVEEINNSPVILSKEAGDALSNKSFKVDFESRQPKLQEHVAELYIESKKYPINQSRGPLNMERRPQIGRGREFLR